MSHLRFCFASLTRVKVAQNRERSIPKTSRATVRRDMTQRAIYPVTLATLTRDKSRDFLAGVTSVLERQTSNHGDKTNNQIFVLLQD